MAVMMAVMRSPPDRTFLGCGSAKQGKAELKEATCVVRAMREVAVIRSCNGEHANHIECKANSNGYPANANPKSRNTSYMYRPKHTLLKEIHPVKVVFYSYIAVIHDCPSFKLAQPYGAMFPILEQGAARII